MGAKTSQPKGSLGQSWGWESFHFILSATLPPPCCYPRVFFRWFFSCPVSGSAAQPLRNFLFQAFTPSTCHRTNSSLPSPTPLTYSSSWDYESSSKDGLSGSSLPSPSLPYILHLSLECQPSHFLQSTVQIPSSPQILPISLLFFSLTWLLCCNSSRASGFLSLGSGVILGSGSGQALHWVFWLNVADSQPDVTWAISLGVEGPQVTSRCSDESLCWWTVEIVQWARGSCDNFYFWICLEIFIN